MVRISDRPVNGIAMADLTRMRDGRNGGVNPLERLVQITRSNDELLGRLPDLAVGLARARAYSDDPKANPTLAVALVDHARGLYAGALASLRANRAEAIRILRACGQIGAMSDAG